MSDSDPTGRDAEYCQMVLEPILVCEKYKPKMGRAGEGYELEAFQNLYREDPFYSWLGLDSPLVYTAHKAAGGITSIYRQIGIGCERLFRQILVNELNLSPSDACWSYETPAKSGKPRTLHLDARIPVAAISKCPSARNRSGLAGTRSSKRRRITPRNPSIDGHSLRSSPRLQKQRQQAPACRYGQRGGSLCKYVSSLRGRAVESN